MYKILRICVNERRRCALRMVLFNAIIIYNKTRFFRINKCPSIVFKHFLDGMFIVAGGLASSLPSSLFQSQEVDRLTLCGKRSQFLSFSILESFWICCKLDSEKFGFLSVLISKNFNEKSFWLFYFLIYSSFITVLQSYILGQKFLS